MLRRLARWWRRRRADSARARTEAAMQSSLACADLMRWEMPRIEAAFREVLAMREEILRAFIARHGCGPDEVEIVEEDRGAVRTWSVRRKKA